jgi:hypothetical protein
VRAAARRLVAAPGGWPIHLLLAALLVPRASFLGEALFDRDLHGQWYPRALAFAQAARGGCLRSGTRGSASASRGWPIRAPSCSIRRPGSVPSCARGGLYPLTRSAISRSRAPASRARACLGPAAYRVARRGRRVPALRAVRLAREPVAPPRGRCVDALGRARRAPPGPPPATRDGDPARRVLALQVLAGSADMVLMTAALSLPGRRWLAPRRAPRDRRRGRGAALLACSCPPVNGFPRSTSRPTRSGASCPSSWPTAGPCPPPDSCEPCLPLDGSGRLVVDTANASSLRSTRPPSRSWGRSTSGSCRSRSREPASWAGDDVR